jgi:aldehyde dehydrogenase (NAD+)
MTSAVAPRYGQFIGGEETPGASGRDQPILNPATNEPITIASVGSADDARHAMEVARKAFESSGWADDDGARRAKALWRLAQRLEESGDTFAQLESLNQGKTLKEGKVDIQFTVRGLEYFAGLADKVQGETIQVPGGRLDYTLREPVGVTVHIAPWNYPLLLALRSIAPALAAGNAVVLKPASLTPLTSLAFAKLAAGAGIPPGIFNVVVGSGSEVGEALIRDPRCASVSFTGGVEVGTRISTLAAERRIPIALELGGKGPVIVFPEADLDRAAKGIGWGIFGNAGQMCWAGSRLLVHASVHDELVAKVRAVAEKIQVGPGTEAGSDMGPLVSRDHQQRVMGFVTGATEEGARIVSGGTPYTDGPLARGNFVPPTVLDGVAPDARVAREEVFGPVLAVHTFSNVDDAVRIANASTYGLMGSVWTRDLATAHHVARRLECGMVTINDPPLTFPQAPFGGYKDSGLGSEQGREAIYYFTRRKNVIVNLAMPKPKTG